MITHSDVAWARERLIAQLEEREGAEPEGAPAASKDGGRVVGFLQGLQNRSIAFGERYDATLAAVFYRILEDDRICPAGRTFWFILNRFPGSNSALSTASRANFSGPYAALMRSQTM